MADEKSKTDAAMGNEKSEINAARREKYFNDPPQYTEQSQDVTSDADREEDLPNYTDARTGDPEKSQQSTPDADREEEYLAPLELLAGVGHVVFFRKDYTLAQHFDFLAKRIGLNSPIDDYKIAERLRFYYEKKVIYVAQIPEPMLDHVRRDPGVRDVAEFFRDSELHLDRISDYRHPRSNPFVPSGPNGNWFVQFRRSYMPYKIKDHFKRIGISFPLDKLDYESLRGYYCPMTEKQRYIVLRDEKVAEVIQDKVEAAVFLTTKRPAAKE